MNDAEENVHGRKLALKVIQHRIERTRVTCFPEILKSVAEKLSREARIGHLVACFSTSRDSLEQWRGYGGSAGVCLAVNGLTGHSEISTKVSHEATKSNTPVFVAPDQVPLEVQYRWRRKATILLSVIGRFERQYELDRSAMPERWPHDHDEQYVEYLYDTLMHYILILKNDAFEKENEARIVLPYSAIKKFRSGLQFRPSNLGLIPYVCTGDHLGNTGQMPIKEVIVGPSAHKDLIAESITTFLEHMGYRDVPVSLSTVPFRS
ncbi:DUF2971 domain-containing protein [Ruegeria arenilitoris]|uniref:DUF2971 domain-containing protein n=1 Tax=Ruegeria arenilitoris TaxID=1173585 RepID=UPI001C2CAB86|nr:DUF2971 domain-containing protein [Ruegeria arenilitoris]